MYFQGERQLIELLRYVEDAIGYKKGKGKKSTLPVAEKVNVPTEEIDDNITSVANEAPKLFLFFKGNVFQLAEVGGDRSVIHLQAGDIVKGLVTFLGVYFVFHIGYPREYSQFIGFLQQILLCLPFEGKKTAGFTDLMFKFDKKLEEIKDAANFKKLCV